MAKGKDTGPGEVTEVIVQDPAVPFDTAQSRLQNFNFDGDELKAEHTQYLNANVIPVLLRSRFFVRIKGMASMSGDFNYNLKLSLRRALHVREHLVSHGVATIMPVTAVGESQANEPIEAKAGADRAVHITFLPGFRPKPIDRPPPAKIDPPIVPTFPPFVPGEPETEDPTEKNSETWELRIVKGERVSKVSKGLPKPVDIDLVEYEFELRDVENNATFTVVLGGGRMRVGTHLLVPKPGRFGKQFKTPRLRAKDLMGAANFTAGGVAAANRGVVVFNGAVGGARAADVPLDFPLVGTTIVEGGSARIDGTKASKSKP
jgi:hypothetical protein